MELLGGLHQRSQNVIVETDDEAGAARTGEVRTMDDQHASKGSALVAEAAVPTKGRRA